MGIAVVLSASGAPGVTTATLGIALSSPQPTLVIEADTSRTSDILAGYFRGTIPAGSRGLDGVAALVASRDLTPITIQSQEIPANESTMIVPGFQRLETGSAANALWPELAAGLLDVSQTGRDVLVDLGRWNVDDVRSALLRVADAVIVVTKTQLPAVAAARALLAHLAAGEVLADAGDRLRVVLRDGGVRGYDEAAIRKVLSAVVPTTVLGHLPDDERGAAVISLGTESTGAKTRRTPFARAVAALGTDLRRHFTARDEQLEQLAAHQSYEEGTL